MIFKDWNIASQYIGNVLIWKATSTAFLGGTKQLISSRNMMTNHNAFNEPKSCLNEIWDKMTRKMVKTAKKPPMMNVICQDG